MLPTSATGGSLKAKLLQCSGFLTGFKVYCAWKPEEYIRFLKDNGFALMEHETLRSGIPIELAVCRTV